MFNNPLIERYRFSLMRPPQFWIYLSIYVAIVALVLLINIVAFSRGSYDGKFDVFGISMLGQFVSFQILIVWFWTSVNVGTVIRNEVRDRSYDFFKLIPLPAWKKAQGILIGKNLVAHLFAGVNFVFIFIFAIMGKVSLVVLLDLLLVIVCGSVFLNIATLLAATFVQKVGKRSTGPVAIIILAFFLLAPLLSLASSLGDDLNNHQISFYSWNLRSIPFISILALYFAVWMFKGVCRRLRSERESLFDSQGAVLFHLGITLIVLGFFWDELVSSMQSTVVIGFWVATLVATWIIPLGAARSYAMYIEGAGQYAKRQHAMTLFLFKSSNLNTCGAVLLLWVLAALFTAVIANMPLGDAVCWLLILSTSTLLLFLLWELHIVYKSFDKKIHLILGFVALLYLVLPLILAGVFNIRQIAQLSPLGFIAHLFATSLSPSTASYVIVIVNLALCAITTAILLPHYRRALAVRGKMHDEAITP